LKLRRVLWAAIAAAPLSGCGSNDHLPPRFPVRGQVLQAGKPIADAIVTLHPSSSSPDLTQRPIAYSDAEGRFSMTTFETGDGAPTGKYAITVEWRAPRTVGEEVIRDGRNLLPPRYSEPETSKLNVNVTEGDNEIPPIDIPRR
jgi:hypothetical protein